MPLDGELWQALVRISGLQQRFVDHGVGGMSGEEVRQLLTAVSYDLGSEFGDRSVVGDTTELRLSDHLVDHRGDDRCVRRDGPSGDDGVGGGRRRVDTDHDPVIRASYGSADEEQWAVAVAGESTSSGADEESAHTRAAVGPGDDEVDIEQACELDDLDERGPVGDMELRSRMDPGEMTAQFVLGQVTIHGGNEVDRFVAGVDDLDGVQSGARLAAIDAARTTARRPDGPPSVAARMRVRLRVMTVGFLLRSRHRCRRAGRGADRLRRRRS